MVTCTYCVCQCEDCEIGSCPKPIYCPFHMKNFNEWIVMGWALTICYSLITITITCAPPYDIHWSVWTFCGVSLGIIPFLVILLQNSRGFYDFKDKEEWQDNAGCGIWTCIIIFILYGVACIISGAMMWAWSSGYFKSKYDGHSDYDIYNEFGLKGIYIMAMFSIAAILYCVTIIGMSGYMLYTVIKSCPCTIKKKSIEILTCGQ